MLLLVLSDIHADASALERVLEHARPSGWERAVLLGDLVGYGDEPAETLAILRELPLRAAVRGNHEGMLAALERGDPVRAASGILETLAAHGRALRPADREFLARLCAEHLDETWAAVHATPRDPDEYLISVPAARANAPHMKRDLYLVGHTHVPAAYLQAKGEPWRVRHFRAGTTTTRLRPDQKAFLNPGSVSRSRDGLPGASYALFDEEARTFTLVRFGG